MKKHKGKILVLFLAVLLVSVMSCENPFLKKMLVEEEKGKTVPAAPEKPQLPNPQAPRYTITFGVEGGLGTLKATVDGNEINSGDSVEQGKSVVFTAEPAEGYVLEQWTNAGLAITEAGTDKTYTRTVTAAVDVKVSFDAPFIEGGASLILSPDKLDIKVKVTTADNSYVRIEGCTETELTSGTETVLHAKGRRVILKGKITELDCSGIYHNPNKLTALNIQGLPALQGLYCNNNQLTELNVQGLTALQKLECGYNQLTELNVQGLTALQKLECGGNQLTALNVQGLTALQGLWCDSNKLAELNVQGLTDLGTLHCNGNQLTALNVQGLAALKNLGCIRNQLTALNVQGLTALRGLYCWSNPLTELNVQGCTALQTLNCSYNQLTELNVQGCTALQMLYCDGNQLTELNAQGCTALYWLYCDGNQLTELNVQGCTALQMLYCDGNQLTELNVQGCTALQGLSCYNNKLTELNVHGLTALRSLYCSGNQLTALNVQGLTALQWLNCSGNQLNADAFKKLFDDLPQRADSDDARCILYSEESGVTEGNHTDFTAPQDLKDAFNDAKNNKKWKMYKLNGSWSEVEI